MAVTIDLSGRVALVTGAGTGIGNGTASVLAAAGAHVVVADLDRSAAGAAVDAIVDAGGAAEALTVDVRDGDAVHAMAEQIIGTHGHLDVLVNNVGHYIGATPFEKSDFAHWDALHAINFAHVLELHAASSCRGCSSARPDRSSTCRRSRAFGGIRPTPCTARTRRRSSTSRGASRSTSQDAACASNAIAPDVTQTPQVDYRNRIPEDMWDRWPLWVPVGRVGEPADNADVVLFLASDLSRWVTGHVIPTDGGTLAAGGWFRTSPGGRWTNRPREA